MPTTPTTWELFECEKGNRWSCTTSHNGVFSEKDGAFCTFSGCKENHHRIKLVGTTTNPPYDWFRNVYAPKPARDPQTAIKCVIKSRLGHGADPASVIWWLQAIKRAWSGSPAMQEMITAEICKLERRINP